MQDKTKTTKNGFTHGWGPSDLKEMSDAIHYPEHWDTACYPTLLDAIHEIVTNSGCSECKNPCIDEDEGIQHNDVLEG